ncbi:universal stress protein [Pseudonocardia yunnanensis]|uniref:Universal stress protein n=1 Tax=Pseudonocardia yunnanensis TaxID=58107 RepID=A0ABW4EPR0_9PSEU
MAGAWRLAQPVVVGVDGSGPALAATRWAAREAERRRVGLRVVKAFLERPSKRIGAPGPDPGHREVMLEGARAAVAEAATVAASTAPGIEVVEDVVDGRPLSVLVAESQHAGTIVVGKRGLGGYGGLLVGSVAVGLTTQARCPAVVVRGGEHAADGPVVVGIGISATSDAALIFALEVAAARGVPLVAVHAWMEYIADPAVWPVQEWGAIDADQDQMLAARLAQWSEKQPDVEIRRVVARDRPAHALLEQAALAQLVVVGSRGRGTFRKRVFGSVCDTVLQHAPCPVAVVRPHPADLVA